ncbi:hypothetical protein EB796_001298 [Bugula neritina]|uniref:Uncharacterized protein n=1 Tax=Bugula neritina TaxID=10212 RepID=A0A7J7KQE7_BUGNE|nr:hypothetical protein EB796_001298 [Bugula neritina]
MSDDYNLRHRVKCATPFAIGQDVHLRAEGKKGTVWLQQVVRLWSQVVGLSSGETRFLLLLVRRSCRVKRKCRKRHCKGRHYLSQGSFLDRACDKSVRHAVKLKNLNSQHQGRTWIPLQM